MDTGIGLIAGRFRLEGLLGSGGTASVFAAVDTVLERPVAIKLLHPHLSESPALREAFLDEARRAAAVSHPGIVEVVDLGTFRDDDVSIAWIAQELLEGMTLAEHVRARGPLPVSAVVRIGTAVLDALQAAHAGGLVHRDVSPSNVLVRFHDDEPVRATLLDFGLADAVGRTAHGDDVLRSSASAQAGVVGNAQYASPEQLRGEPIDARGDLYQVGGTLYFALTGRAPFEGGDRDAVVRAQLSAPPPVASVRARGVPPTLDRVLVRALLKEPDRRFADAAEMRSALAAVVPASAPASATRVLRPSPAPPTPGDDPAPPTPGDDPAPAAPSGGGRPDLPGWAAAAAVILVLASVAVAVPLMASAGRQAPSAVASDAPAPASEPSTPTPSDPEPSTVLADTVVPELGRIEQALSAIAAAGLVAGQVTQQDSAVAAGTVLSSDPATGARVARGTVVRLVAASGSNAVPLTTGWTSADATAAIRAAGFSAAPVEVAADSPVGTVVGSEPAAGASAAVGSSVRLLISGGRPAVPTPTPTISATPTAAPSPTPTPTPTATARAGR